MLCGLLDCVFPHSAVPKLEFIVYLQTVEVAWSFKTERKMDCSLREALRKEQSTAPNNAFFEPIRTTKGPTFLTQELSWCFKKQLDFLQDKEWFFRCFLRPCISGTFCRFLLCYLSCLSQWGAAGVDEAPD